MLPGLFNLRHDQEGGAKVDDLVDSIIIVESLLHLGMDFIPRGIGYNLLAYPDDICVVLQTKILSVLEMASHTLRIKCEVGWRWTCCPVSGFRPELLRYIVLH